MAVGNRVMSGMTKNEIDSLNSTISGKLNTDRMFLLSDQRLYFHPTYRNAEVTDVRITTNSCADVTFLDVDKMSDANMVADTMDGSIYFECGGLPVGTWELESGSVPGCYCRTGKAIVDSDRRIHVIGGIGSGNRRSHYIKDDSGSWSQLADAPMNANSGCTILDAEGYINVLGGSGTDEDGVSSGLSHYRYKNGNWEFVSTLPYNFTGGSAVLFNGNIHIFGGGYDSEQLNHYSYSGGSWINEGSLPYPLSDGFVCVDSENTLHILGGVRSDDDASDLYNKNHYIMSDVGWERVESLPVSVYQSFVAYDTIGQMHIMGGLYNNKDHWIYKNGKWEQLEDLPFYFINDPGCTTLDGEIVLFLEETIGSGMNVTYYETHYKYTTLCNILVTNP